MKIKPTISIPLGLTIDGAEAKKIVGRVGRAAAKAVKARFASGKGADGVSLPMPDDRDNVGLRRSGQLLDSLGFRPDRKTKGETGVVYATGTRTGGSPKSAQRNGAVLAIQLATRAEVAKADPMGVDEPLQALMQTKAQEAIVKVKMKSIHRRKVK